MPREATHNCKCPKTTDKDKLKEVFKRLDSNGDGRVSREELKTALSGHVYFAGLKANWGMAFADTDKNGFITEDEMLALMQPLLSLLRVVPKNMSQKEDDTDTLPVSEAELKEMFRRLDTDADGRVSREELKKVLSSHLYFTSLRTNWAMAFADTDKNWYITEDEMLALTEYDQKYWGVL
ncbi:hypothetical protein HHK36_009936 [Tetracentron sinense]|uniref:EF-hand domain-containing protein n=1 Tax=Tetracentron sinense TaxID=13715 RepID=A0A834ZBP8_TETSI|nr:hypothetical protein HHK36_009936 [Tetracentron sinense]